MRNTERDTQINVILTKEQKELFQEYAKKSQQSMSAFLVTSALERVKRIRREEKKEQE